MRNKLTISFLTAEDAKGAGAKNAENIRKCLRSCQKKCSVFSVPSLRPLRLKKGIYSIRIPNHKPEPREVANDAVEGYQRGQGIVECH